MTKGKSVHGPGMLDYSEIASNLTQQAHEKALNEIADRACYSGVGVRSPAPDSNIANGKDSSLS